MNELLIWGLVLLAAAVLLLALELFIPSGGLLSVGSAVLAAGGLVCLYRFDTTWGLMGTLGVLIVGPLLLMYGLSIWRHTPIGRKIINAPSEEDVAEASLAALRIEQERQRFLGREGLAVTDLRPVGVIKIDDEKHDATCELGFTPAGTRVKVSGIEPSQLRVRPV